MSSKLENIGFYTLSDARAKTSSMNSPLWRCEMILTNRCNFRCKYCRNVGEEISYRQAVKTLLFWIKDGLKNVRFSGGEPTLYKNLPELVRICRENNVERIALSTNGSAKEEYYQELIDAGVNDFSVSLDSCCASEADKISGKSGAWGIVCDNIRYLAERVYTTVGIVINDDNIENSINTIGFAAKLGVSDIRIIPAAQYGPYLDKLKELLLPGIEMFPILKYRLLNCEAKRHVRGLKDSDSKKCGLVLDDMAVMGKHHYPCIIYMREGGRPIGRVSSDMRVERAVWSETHNCHNDPICKNNCLDVCIDFNNAKTKSRKSSYKVK